MVPTPDGRTTVRLTATGFPDDDAGRALVAFFRDGNGRTLDQLRQRFVAAVLGRRGEDARVSGCGNGACHRHRRERRE